MILSVDTAVVFILYGLHIESNSGADDSAVILRAAKYFPVIEEIHNKKNTF